MRQLIISALVALAVASNRGAQAQTYFGPGNVPCEQFNALAADNSPTAKSIDFWLRGYLSGLNAAWKGVKGTDRLINVDSKNVTLFVLRYCDANPRKNILNAVNDYFWSLPQ